MSGLPNPRPLIEDAAKDLHGCRERGETVLEREAVVSIAISLKRLADVAEATAMGLWNYDPTRNSRGNPKVSA